MVAEMFSKKKRIDKESPGPAQWLTTFNDLTTLLMVFFVMLFSLGNLNFHRFQDFQNALQGALGVLNAGNVTSKGILSKAHQPSWAEEGKDIPPSKVMDENSLEATEGLEAEYTAKGIRLVLEDRMLFSSGSATLSESGQAMLSKVSKIIRPLNRFVRIEGHTDDLPIATRRYPSNWDLSTARAISVVNYFIQQAGFPPSQISAAGYGPWRPRVDNISQEQRAKNRRVEIILEQPVTSASVQILQDNGGN